jgi:hypothetical protein
MVLLLAVFYCSLCPLSQPALAADSVAAAEEKSSSMQMMERIETILYGEPSKGGLIDRLNAVEKDLFGRSLPGSISERHTAILNFLEVGTADQPSMLFKLGVAEWIVGQSVQVQKAALKRLEALETDLSGDMRYGQPIAMRLETILRTLVSDPVTFKELVLPGATVLKTRLLAELSPAKSRKGDPVWLTLTNDLLLDNTLIAPRGTLVDARVREVKQPRAFGVPGEVRVDFHSLMALGPQHPLVTVGDAAKKAAELAKQAPDKGEGGIIGAGAASIGGAVLLGPLGLVAGAAVRGNALKIPEGSTIFLETSGDAVVSGYPVPNSLKVDPNATIRESIVPVTTVTTTTTTVKTTTMTPASQARPSQSSKSTTSSTIVERETIELPAEQKVE